MIIRDGILLPDALKLDSPRLPVIRIRLRDGLDVFELYPRRPRTAINAASKSAKRRLLLPRNDIARARASLRSRRKESTENPNHLAIHLMNVITIAFVMISQQGRQSIGQLTAKLQLYYLFED